MEEHCHCGDCGGNEPLTRESVLDTAFSLVQDGADHVDAGRISEGTALNVLAQTLIALAERIPVAMLAGPVH